MRHFAKLHLGLIAQSNLHGLAVITVKKYTLNKIKRGKIYNQVFFNELEIEIEIEE